jgi:hypothetical protein
VVEHNGNVYAVAANGPDYAHSENPLNSVYVVGNPTPILDKIGVGFVGGIAFDSAGNMLLADSNDPDFLGNAGKVLRYDPSLNPLPSIDLSGGGGSGAFDLALDTEGDIFVSTNTTVTKVDHANLNIVTQFGSAFSPTEPGPFGFTFISAMDFGGTNFTGASDTGRLWINAVDSEDAAIIAVQTPEPAGIALLALAASALLIKRRRVAATVAASLAVFATGFIGSSARADQFFATQVISTTVGAGQQDGFTNPNLALGGPRGGGLNSGSTDTYCLGNGGSITLGFDDSDPSSHRYIVDGPGPDFLVAENPFDQAGNPHRSFAELMFVEVSSDGTNFQRFQNFSATPGPIAATGVLDPDNLAGFAGVNPVYADVGDATTPGNGIDPFDVAVAGGDVFDLHSLSNLPLVQSDVVDLQHIRYLRLIDVIGNGSTLDSFGRPIYDPTGAIIGGADVDAVTVINGAHAPEPSVGLPLCALMLAARRRA